MCELYGCITLQCFKVNTCSGLPEDYCCKIFNIFAVVKCSWLANSTFDPLLIFQLGVRSKPTRFPFFLHFLRLVGLLISLALFLTNLHHLQHHSGIHLVSLNLGLGLEVYWVSLYKFSSILVIAGLSTLLMGIFGSGKEMLLVCIYKFLEYWKLL